MKPDLLADLPQREPFLLSLSEGFAPCLLGCVGVAYKFALGSLDGAACSLVLDLVGHGCSLFGLSADSFGSTKETRSYGRFSDEVDAEKEPKLPRMGRSYTQADLKVLWGAATICSHPECSKRLVAKATEADDARSIGKICHIIASSDDGPRGDPDFPQEQRDHPDNLILLCGTHHDEIDAQPNTYSVAELREWKETQERWVEDTLSDAVVALTFNELEAVARNLLSTTPTALGELVPPTPPLRKMRHNGLTGTVASHFQIGQLRFYDVEAFINDQTGWDVDFGERLKAGFVEQYDALWERDLRGDDLYISLAEWSAGGPRAPLERQAAGAAILSYLFHVCDVFEPEPSDDSSD